MPIMLGSLLMMSSKWPGPHFVYLVMHPEECWEFSPAFPSEKLSRGLFPGFSLCLCLLTQEACTADSSPDIWRQQFREFYVLKLNVQSFPIVIMIRLRVIIIIATIIFTVSSSNHYTEIHICHPAILFSEDIADEPYGTTILWIKNGELQPFQMVQPNITFQFPAGSQDDYIDSSWHHLMTEKNHRCLLIDLLALSLAFSHVFVVRWLRINSIKCNSIEPLLFI